MSRYIDADAFKRNNADLLHCDFPYLCEDTLEEIIDAMPTADVVEVVRCKNCKWFNQIGCAICIVDDSDKPTENDFCSFAERRTHDN